MVDEMRNDMMQAEHKHAMRMQASVRGVLSRKQILRPGEGRKKNGEAAAKDEGEEGIANAKPRSWGSLLVFWALGLEVKEAKYCYLWSILTLSFRVSGVEWLEAVGHECRIESLQVRILFLGILLQILLWWRKVPVVSICLEDVKVSLTGDEELTTVLNSLIQRDFERRLHHRISLRRAAVVQKGKAIERRFEVDAVQISASGNFTFSNCRWRWLTDDGSTAMINIAPNGTVAIRAQPKSTQLWHAFRDGPKWPPKNCQLHLKTKPSTAIRSSPKDNTNTCAHYFGRTSLRVDLGNDFTLMLQAPAFVSQTDHLESEDVSWHLLDLSHLTTSKKKNITNAHQVISQGRLNTVHLSLSGEKHDCVKCRCDEEVHFEISGHIFVSATVVSDILGRLCPHFEASAPEARLQFFDGRLVTRLSEPSVGWNTDAKNFNCTGDPFAAQRRGCLIASLEATEVQCLGRHQFSGIHAVGCGLKASFENSAALARKFRIEPDSTNLLIARPSLDLTLGQFDIKDSATKNNKDNEELVTLLASTLLLSGSSIEEDKDMLSPMETTIRIARCVCLDHVLGVVLARLYDDELWPRTRLAIDTMNDDTTLDEVQTLNLRCSRLRPHGWALARQKKSAVRFDGDDGVLDGAPVLDVDLKLSTARIGLIPSLTKWSWITRLSAILRDAVPMLRLAIRAEKLTLILPGEGDELRLTRAMLLLGTAPTEVQATDVNLVAEYGAPAAHGGLLKARIVDEEDKKRVDVLALDITVDDLRNLRQVWRRSKDQVSAIDFTLRLERLSFSLVGTEYLVKLGLVTVMALFSEGNEKCSLCVNAYKFIVGPQLKARREELLSCREINYVAERVGVVAKSRAKFSVLRGALHATDSAPLLTICAELLLEPTLLAPSLRGSALSIEASRVHIRFLPTAPHTSYLELTLQAIALDLRNVNGKPSIIFRTHALALLDLISSRLLATAGQIKTLAHRDAPDDMSPPSVKSSDQMLCYNYEEDDTLPTALETCLTALVNEWSPTLVDDLVTPITRLWKHTAPAADNVVHDQHRSASTNGRHSMLRASMNHGRLAHQGTKRASASPAIVSSSSSTADAIQNPLLQHQDDAGTMQRPSQDSAHAIENDAQAPPAASHASSKRHSLARASLLHARQAHDRNSILTSRQQHAAAAVTSRVASKDDHDHHNEDEERKEEEAE